MDIIQRSFDKDYLGSSGLGSCIYQIFLVDVTLVIAQQGSGTFQSNMLDDMNKNPDSDPDSDIRHHVPTGSFIWIADLNPKLVLVLID